MTTSHSIFFTLKHQQNTESSFYVRIVNNYCTKCFESLCCGHLGAAYIPYVQNAILNLSDPYLRTTTTLLNNNKTTTLAITYLSSKFVFTTYKYLLRPKCEERTKTWSWQPFQTYCKVLIFHGPGIPKLFMNQPSFAKFGFNEKYVNIM